VRVRAQGEHPWAATQAGVRGRRQLRDGGHPRDHRKVRGHRRGQIGAFQGRRGRFRGQRGQVSENRQGHRRGDGLKVLIKLHFRFVFAVTALFGY